MDPRPPIDLPDHYNDDETDGDGAIRIIAVAFFVVLVVAAVLIFVVMP